MSKLFLMKDTSGRGYAAVHDMYSIMKSVEAGSEVTLTKCCSAYSTYHDHDLCCKVCMKEVAVGEGDGCDWEGKEEVTGLVIFGEIGEQVTLDSQACTITRIPDRDDYAIEFLKSCEMTTLPATEHFSFDDGQYSISLSDGCYYCIVGNREVKSKNLLHVVAELLEFIQAGEEK